MGKGNNLQNENNTDHKTKKTALAGQLFSKPGHTQTEQNQAHGKKLQHV